MSSTPRSEETILPKDGDLIVKSTKRPSFEDVFFDIAWTMGSRATCPRKSVGCVIVDERNSIIASGYNGAPRGMPHCSDVGCLLEGGHCVRAVHAEINAIASAARNGISLEGCSAYCTLLPCINCMQAMLACGIRVVNFDDSYRRREQANVHRLAKLGNLWLVERTRQ